MQQNFFLSAIEKDFNNSLIDSFFLSSRISNLKKEIMFIKSILEQTNTPQESESGFFNNAFEQINKYSQALKLNNEKLNILHSQKKRIQNALFDKSKGYIKNYLEQQNQKETRLFIGVEKDTNEYITIDKRQNITKTDLKLFLNKLYLKGTINKNEYRKAIKYSILNNEVKQRLKYIEVFTLIGILPNINETTFKNALNKAWDVLSENVRARLNLYSSHVLAKTSHKKHLLNTSRENKAKYEYNPITKSLIKFRSFSEYFNQSFINREIENKIKAESQIFIYHKA